VPVIERFCVWMSERIEQTSDETDLHQAVLKLTEQLRQAIDGEQPPVVNVETRDPAMLGLTTLINDALGNARDAVLHLETLNRDLDQNIRERTAELEYARSIAEQGSNAKSNFLAQMSHELRTPLNAIIGFAQLLIDSRKEPISEKQHKQLGHILQGGQHLLGLINDVLDLTKIESGRLDLQIEAVDPGLIITESLQMISPLTDNYAIHFENRIAAVKSLPWVKCDPLRVKQCLINLLNNAFKYNNQKGSVWIDVRIFENERLRFIVGDTGIGIPLNRQHELFRPFSRLGREDTDVEGSGVGLALTRLLVDSMDGALDYISVEGQGSQFWFDLPIALQPEYIPVTEDPISVTTRSRPQGLVLYIEDVASNVLLMRDILNEYTDVQLLTANSAEAGIRLTREQLPDLIIMDINLSGMNGIDAIRYIRSVTLIKNIPVFVLTGDAREETRRRCVDAGIEMFFSKPVDVPAFVKAVCWCLDQKLGKLL
jgi:signal transduction histidine kinase/ActR/RegA family two-component response regulator